MLKIVTLLTLVFSSLSLSANNLYEYNLLKSQFGYMLFEKDGIYIQRINLKNVDIRFVHGSQNSSLFQKGSIENWWSGMNQVFSDDLISINNLSFFESLSGNSTQLSFPYKSLGTIRTFGASNGFPYARKMLAIKNSCYDNRPCPLITDYNVNTFNSNNFDNVIVGLDPFDSDVTDNISGKRGSINIGRTYAGVSYDISSTPILYVIVAKQATNNEMTDALHDLGVSSDNMVMFDGSGSSQLISGNTKVYGSKNPAYYSIDKRKIPQVMVISKK
ncbi:MAG: hypothetical protein GY828_05255 [Candidatus Gracilibacteria bacterium]|nr:hypothetical protein [Candidatus Gracilibacteria bacterium]